MTVEELIQELQKYDSTLEVMCRNSEGDRGNLKEVKLTRSWWNTEDTVVLESDI